MVILFSTMLYARDARLILGSDSISRGEHTHIQLILNDISLSSPPRLPVGSGVYIQSNQNEPQQEILVENGVYTTQYVYEYRILGAAEGVWRIGPASFSYQGRSYVAAAVDLSVLPPKSTEAIKERLETKIDVTEPYVGSVVHYHVHFETQREKIELELKLPNFSSLASIKIKDQKSEISTKIKSGKVYTSLDYVLPLVVQSQSLYETTPAQLLVRTQRYVMSPFGELDDIQFQEEVVLGEPLLGKVKPLPSPPKDFSGLVGAFRLRAYARKVVVEVGAPVEIVFELWGGGVVKGFKLRKTSSPLFESHDMQPTLEESIKEGKYEAKWKQIRTIVPTKEGSIFLEAIALTVFNPVTETYETLRSDPISLHVASSQEDSPVSKRSLPPPSQKPEIEITDYPAQPSILWWVHIVPWVLFAFPVFWWAKKHISLPRSHRTFASLPTDRAERLRFLEELLDRYEARYAARKNTDVLELRRRLYEIRYGEGEEGSIAEDIQKAIQC